MRREPALYRSSEKQRENKNPEFRTQIAVPEQTPQPAFRTVNSGSYIIILLKTRKQ